MNIDKQQQAQDLYFTTGNTQQEIADILDVSRKTVNGWIKRNRWDEMKTAARQMPSLILHDIYSHINAINDKIFARDEADRCPTMKEVQMLHKLLAMTKSIQKQHTGSYLEAFQELQLFIFNRDSTLAVQLREHIAAYARGTLGDKEFMARKRRKDNVLDVTANLGKEELRSGVPHPGPYEGQSVATPPAQHEEGTAHINRENIERECNPNVTLCNPTGPAIPHPGPAEGQSVATPPAQHNSLGVQTRCAASTLAQDECNSAVTLYNHTGPVAPHVQSVAPSPVQRNSLGVQTQCAASALTQDGCNPGVTLCNPNEQNDQSTILKKVMTLPLHMRPSPFVDGDTVWILDSRHLDNKYDTYGNPWGPMKMGYTVRFYPGIDPANTIAA